MLVRFVSIVPMTRLDKLLSSSPGQSQRDSRFRVVVWQRNGTFRQQKRQPVQ